MDLTLRGKGRSNGLVFVDLGEADWDDRNEEKTIGPMQKTHEPHACTDFDSISSLSSSWIIDGSGFLEDPDGACLSIWFPT